VPGRPLTKSELDDINRGMSKETHRGYTFQGEESAKYLDKLGKEENTVYSGAFRGYITKEGKYEGAVYLRPDATQYEMMHELDLTPFSPS